MAINLKIKHEKPKGLSINDIQDGFFILKDEDVWVIKKDFMNKSPYI
ncbi:hypothetical protein MOC71_16445 [Bacillus vallismortis]|uniref:Uncharacterized protein n=1 Tax=Bacillus vallismortis TaxID=72361 RepID=A0AAP3CKZ6_BACVA|nr:hypothetical protein [Bacillus vallismortis]